MSMKTRTTKEKYSGKFDFNRIEHFYEFKDTIKAIRQTQNRGKYVQIVYLTGIRIENMQRTTTAQQKQPSWKMDEEAVVVQPAKLPLGRLHPVSERRVGEPAMHPQSSFPPTHPVPLRSRYLPGRLGWISWFPTSALPSPGCGWLIWNYPRDVRHFSLLTPLLLCPLYMNVFGR